jgi:hypothetical protein
MVVGANASPVGKRQDSVGSAREPTQWECSPKAAALRVAHPFPLPTRRRPLSGLLFRTDEPANECNPGV